MMRVARSGLIVLALSGTLVALMPTGAAHPWNSGATQYEEHRGYQMILQDCVDDWGSDSAPSDGQDLGVLSVWPDASEGGAGGVKFYLGFQGGWNSLNPAPGPREIHITFSSPDRSGFKIQIDFTDPQTFSFSGDITPVWHSNSYNPTLWSAPSSDPDDPSRQAIEFLFTYEQLRLANGNALTFPQEAGLSTYGNDDHKADILAGGQYAPDGQTKTHTCPLGNELAVGTMPPVTHSTWTKDSGGTGGDGSGGGTTVTNAPPIADFSWAPFAPHAGTPIQFADASSDTDGSIAAWHWSFGDGTTSAVAAPTHAYAAKGNYVATLTVTDNAGALSDAVSHEIYVPGFAPVAGIAFANETAMTGANVALTDTSTDVDGHVISWRWEFPDGSNATTQNTTHAFAFRGEALVNLTATDDDGMNATASRVLHVRDPPHATFELTSHDLRITVDASRTTGDGANVTTYAWDWGDGSPNATGATASHTYATLGPFNVTLHVVDERGFASSVTRIVALDPRAPLASFTTDPRDQAIVGQPVRFLDQSQAHEGVLLPRSWDFGDGALSNETRPSHAFAGPGRFHVVLDVTDSFGITSQATGDLLVLAPPLARADLSFTGLVVHANASNSTDADDGAIASYTWDWGDGSTPASGVAATHRYAAPGPYRLSLTVEDAGGLTGELVRDIEPRPLPIVATITLENGAPRQGQPVSLRDSSFSPDGSIASRRFEFGDGTTSTSKAPQHTYELPGNFTVNLSVRDSIGQFARTSIILHVAAAEDRSTGGLPDTAPEPIPTAEPPSPGPAPAAVPAEKRVPAPAPLFALATAALILRTIGAKRRR